MRRTTTIRQLASLYNLERHLCNKCVIYCLDGCFIIRVFVAFLEYLLLLQVVLREMNKNEIIDYIALWVIPLPQLIKNRQETHL